MIFKSQRKLVMKAAEWTRPLGELRFPLLASPKLDGIRAIRRGPYLLSQRGLLIANGYIRAVCAQLPEGVDGELTLSTGTEPMRDVQSAVASQSGEPDFRYRLFDVIPPGPLGRLVRFAERLEYADQIVERFRAAVPVERVANVLCETADELERVMLDNVACGYEGTMTRDPDGCYTFGRPTAATQLLLKHKTFADEEALVLGVEEEVTNTNARDERGIRGSARAGRIGKGRMGKIICRFDDGAEFRCGSGFDSTERELYWAEPYRIIGQRVTIKHQPPPGGRPAGQEPRFPVFKCIRIAE